MSFAEIEAEIERLQPDELRRIAIKSWAAFLNRTGASGAPHECDEDDPRLLTALDEAIARADATPGVGGSAVELRAHLAAWTTR
jgi:hypothetical protein